MKKTAAILLMSLYGILSIGIHLHMHYCCGKLVEVIVNNKATDCCDHTHDVPDNGSISKNCCSNQELIFAIDDEHRTSSAFKFLSLQRIDVVKTSFNREAQEDEANHFTAIDIGPSLIAKRFLRFSSLVFYA